MELTSENYFEYKEVEGVPVLSSSFLKNGMPMWCGNPERLEVIYQDGLTKEATKAMQFGSLVHSFAEDRTRFVFEPEWEMSDTIRTIADKVLATLTNTESAIGESPSRHAVLFETVCEEVGWGQKWKAETRMTKFIDSAHLYWMFRTESVGKIIVTGNEVEKLQGVVKGIEAAGLRTPLLDDIIDNDIETHREMPFAFNMGGIPAKSLMDIVEIDHDTRTLTITDLKTTSGKIENFISGYSYRPNNEGIVERIYTAGDYIRYGYFFQERFYKDAAETYLVMRGLEGYTVKFRFGVVETTAPFLAKMIESPSAWAGIAAFEFDEAMDTARKWIKDKGYLEF